MYGIFLPFNYISSSFFISKWYNNEVTEESLHRAGEAMGIPFLISGFLVPFIGYLVDRYGKRASLMLISAIILLLTFMMFLSINPIYGIISLVLVFLFLRRLFAINYTCCT